MAILNPFSFPNCKNDLNSEHIDWRYSAGNRNIEESLSIWDTDIRWLSNTIEFPLTTGQVQSSYRNRSFHLNRQLQFDISDGDKHLNAWFTCGKPPINLQLDIYHDSRSGPGSKSLLVLLKDIHAFIKISHRSRQTFQNSFASIWWLESND